MRNMGANTYVAKGNAEDVSNIITNISPDETPMTSRFGRTKAVATVHSWLEDALSAPTVNQQPEGGPLTVLVPAPRVPKMNYTQIVERGYEVTGTQEVVLKHGVTSEFAYQMRKAARELALDIESAIITQAAGSLGTVGAPTRIMTGLPGFITTNIFSAGSMSGGQTPTMVPGPLTEGLINDAIQAAWEKGGNPRVVYMSAKNKRAASGFSNSERQRDQKEKKITKTIRFYESDFGTVEFVPHRLVPTTTVFVVDPSFCKLAYLRPIHREVPAKTHDTKKAVLLGELTLEVRADAAHAKITDIA
jgi:hypothetical protein